MVMDANGLGRVGHAGERAAARRSRATRPGASSGHLTGPRADERAHVTRGVVSIRDTG